MMLPTNTTKTVYDDSRMRLFQGNSMRMLSLIPDDTYDAIITDPPYASGGLFTTSRKAPPEKKYHLRNSGKQYPTFGYDMRDQRAQYLWQCDWMTQALRLTQPCGWLMVFTDWRQLPITSDAMQVSGWTWRGILTWDKTEQSRPQKGMFRNQTEFILFATKGKRNMDLNVCPPGMIREPVIPKDKLHMTGKPVKVMSHLMAILKPDSYILDPFAGSSTTLVAADTLGHRCDGIELSEDYCAISKNRLAAHREETK